MPIDISKIKSIISRNLAALQTVEDVAFLSGHSSETLRKTFARIEGESLSRFVQRLRLDRVRFDLVNTEKLCKQILLEHGFKREDSGARTFLRMIGMTMGEFRARGRMEVPHTNLLAQMQLERGEETANSQSGLRVEATGQDESWLSHLPLGSNTD
jgi:AraC-like DNA-binding protein